MPGTKNSGRRKSIQNYPDSSINIPAEKRKKPGRPKKNFEDLSELKNEPNVEGTEQKVDYDSNCDVPNKEASSSHLSNLRKRNSELNRFYDEYMGTALEKFPASKLPTKRTVLQRYRSLRSEEPTNSSLNHTITTMTHEIMDLWQRSCIPMKDQRRCWEAVQQCITKWTKAKKSKKMDPKFQVELDTLLDVRPVDCQKLSSLKDYMRKNDERNWDMDYAFFKGQLKHPQTTSMSSCVDKILTQTIHKRNKRAATASSFKEKNQSPNSVIENQPAKHPSLFSRTMISEENITEVSKRHCYNAHVTHDVEFQSDEGSSASNDEWELPLRKKRELSKRPKEVTLRLPAKEIPKVLAATSTTSKISSRNELKLVSTLFKAGGADLNDACLSVSSIRRQRKQKIKLDASAIRETFSSFKEFTNTFLVLHFDGKIIQLMDGKTEDRLAIALSSPCNLSGQFISSPAIPNGCGDTMAKCVYKVVSELGLLSSVHALVFDTTASNTGRLKGSSTLFEAMLDKAILWLACRHHIPELFIKHANIAIRGESKGPDDTLFKDFKNFFSFIEVTKWSIWTRPNSIRDWRCRRADEVLVWANEHMENTTWPREDYRELLELVVTYLGGSVKRVHRGEITVQPFQVRKPGAVHRARFMASCLYLLKICLYRDQFVTDEQNIQDALILGEYIALIHAPYFLKSPLAISAPRHDRDLWIDLNNYKTCFKLSMRQTRMIESVQDSVKNHLWYLTEELVVFGLFDNKLEIAERKNMAKKILFFPKEKTYKPGKPKFPVMTTNPKLEEFIGPRSWLLFNILNAKGLWLNNNVSEWDEDAEYSRMKKCLNELKVVNDLAERCIKDIQEYADLARDSQYREDILIVATDHRSIFQDLRKNSLALHCNTV